MWNYDILTLARETCKLRGWTPAKISFFIGIPSKKHNPKTHQFWREKLTVMRSQGIETYELPLKYVAATTKRADGTLVTYQQPQEKGVDVRIAVEIVNSAHDPQCDAILLFSQDQDLKQAMLGAHNVAVRTNRMISLACAFPKSRTACVGHGVRGVTSIPIEREVYSRCLDRINYGTTDQPHNQTHESRNHLSRTVAPRARKPARIAVVS